MFCDALCRSSAFELSGCTSMLCDRNSSAAPGQSVATAQAFNFSSSHLFFVAFWLAHTHRELGYVSFAPAMWMIAVHLCQWASVKAIVIAPRNKMNTRPTDSLDATSYTLICTSHDTAAAVGTLGSLVELLAALLKCI